MKTTLNIKTSFMNAKYYYDGSGHLFIETREKYMEPIIGTESGTLMSHIEDVKNKIKEYENGILILKAAKKLLKANVKNLKTLKVYP